MIDYCYNAYMDDISLAQIIWDYLRIDDDLRPSDAIICFGSHDILSAEYSARLFKRGLAPKLLFSGGLGRLTNGTFRKSEAVTFTELAIKLGVPPEAIIVEDTSTNTSENMTLSAAALAKAKISARQVILVHKPYMERRTLATYEVRWPAPRPAPLVTGPPIAFRDYLQRFEPKQVINIMVGDLQRVREYPKLGYQSKQSIPPAVWSAYETLITRGYMDQLIKH